MKVNVFYPLFALAALAVWIKPDAPSAPTAPAPAASAAAAPAANLEVARETDESVGQASLPRADDGHFYADVAINGASAHMLVDTGATTIALTAQDAQAAGLSWQPEDVKPVARGANGEVDGVRLKLDRVQLGDIDLHNIDAVVVPRGLGISLLGQSFLRRVDRVEIGDGKMVLGA